MFKLKHIQSQADISILINDDGSLYIICEQAKKLWAGKLNVVEWPDEDTPTPPPGGALVQPLRELAISNRSFLEEVGMNSEMVNMLIKDL